MSVSEDSIDYERERFEEGNGSSDSDSDAPDEFNLLDERENFQQRMLQEQKGKRSMTDMLKKGKRAFAERVQKSVVLKESKSEEPSHNEDRFEALPEELLEKVEQERQQYLEISQNNKRIQFEEEGSAPGPVRKRRDVILKKYVSFLIPRVPAWEWILCPTSLS